MVRAAQVAPNVSLKVAGRGELGKLVRNAESQSRNVRYLGWLDTERLDDEACESDLIPTLYEPRNKNAQLAIPGKLMTAMSLAMPALVPLGSYQATIVDRFKWGLIVESQNTDEVIDTIERLANDLELYNRPGKAGYDAFQSNFSRETMASTLVSSYSALRGRA